MIQTGLVSITFRKLTPDEIIRLVLEAELSAIEWGGDVHVPHGDVKIAQQVGEMTRTAGLEIAAYGSYYRAGHDDVSFADVLESARVLSAPLIRVWAGKQGSAAADDDYRNRISKDLWRICNLAQDAEIAVALEFHGGTLTDTAQSARELLESVNQPNLSTLWQPPVGMPKEECLAALKLISPWLSNLHVFQWRINEQGGREKLPLQEGEDVWREYLQAAHDGQNRYGLLEFVAEDEPQNFRRDAATLRALISKLQ